MKMAETFTFGNQLCNRLLRQGVLALMVNAGVNGYEC